MDPSTVQLITAGAGIGGTLLASALTHLQVRRSERQRAAREDRQRWNQDRFRVCRDLIAIGVRVEREVRSIQGLLPDNEGVNERLYEAGHSTILTASGVTPSLLGSLAEDEECRRVIAEAVEAVNEAEKFHAELALLASGVLVQLSNDVIGALWQLVGMGEELQSVEKIGKAHDSARKCREAFQAEARTILGVDPEPKKNGSSKGWRRLPQRVVSD